MNRIAVGILIGVAIGADPVNGPGSSSPRPSEAVTMQTQTPVQPVASGHGATHSWRVSAVLDDDDMIDIVAIPGPPGRTSPPSQLRAPDSITCAVWTKAADRRLTPYPRGPPEV